MRMQLRSPRFRRKALCRTWIGILLGLFILNWFLLPRYFFRKESLPIDTATGSIDCLQDFQSTRAPLDRIIVSSSAPLEKKILCYILTVSKFHTTRCKAVKMTWGKRCDRLIFASDVDDVELGAVRIQNTKHDYLNLWEKHRQTLKYIYETYRDEYDWFVKADDDSYLIVENLRALIATPVLSRIEKHIPLYLGHRLRLPPYQYSEINIPQHLLQRFEHEIGPRILYNSGGAGYAMNPKTLEAFMQGYKKPTCLPNIGTVPEDLAFGFCLAWEGVFAWPSRDRLDLERFHLENPADTFAGKPRWVTRYHTGLGGPVAGPESISTETIAFHYATPELMEYIDAQLYKCRGLKFIRH